MKKFVICTDHFQFNPTKHRRETIEQIYLGRDDLDYKECEMFDTLDEARECLESYTVTSRRPATSFAEADVAFIQEGDYEFNEDLNRWEFIEGGDIWDFKARELPRDMYVVYSETFEFNPTEEDDVETAYFNRRDIEPTVVAAFEFDEVSAAEKLLNTIDVNTSVSSDTSATAKVAFIALGEHDGRDGYAFDAFSHTVHEFKCAEMEA